ncbi:MAG: cupin domain-containing protein [Candidatus Nealsonbacteria bacterium]
MKGFIDNIEKLTLENNKFRKVIHTAKHSQLVLMSLKPGEEIGEEAHDTLDQFFRFEKGEGKVIVEGIESKIGDGSAVVIPAGTKHNIINTSSMDTLKLYTIYSPPNHADGVEFETKEEAEASDEHFDGKTTE